MDEKTDMEVLRDTYLRINNLIDFASHENDMRLREYTHELYMHSVRKVEPEVNKRKNMPTKIVASLIDNDDGLSTQKLIEELEDMASKEYEPIHVEVKGLNDEEMQRNHMVFMSLVDRAKRDGHRRIERLKESFEQVTAHQKQIMRQAIDDYKQHRGFHRLKNRILELQNQLSKQRTLLAERKYQYDIRKAESTQSAEELRTKYEFETEELIRSLLTTIDAKQHELEALQQRHEAIRKDIDRICKDLSVVLHDIEKEEKARLGKRHGRRTHINSKPKPENVVSAPSLDDIDSESTKSPAKAKKDEEVTIIDVFPFIKVGELSDEMIQQTYQLVDESASILRAKQEEKEYAEQRLAAKKNELAAILKSEESKALERLKKMVVGLEAKIDSDEKRAALLESLIKNLEQDQKTGANAGKTGNKGVLAPGASSGKDSGGKSSGLAHRRSRNVAYGGGAGGAGGKDVSGDRQRFDDEHVDSDDDGAARRNADDADDDADEVDTGGAPADIERRRLRSLERQAKKRMSERKKPATGAAESVASEGSSSLSFGTNDSNKFQALQAKFLQTAAPPAPHRADSPPKEISFASPAERPGSTSTAANAATKATTPQTGARPGSKPATAGSDAAGEDSRPGTVAQRFIAPSQLTKIVQTMEAFEQFLRPPAWALGASNVLIPYSQRPLLPVASAPKPAQSPSDTDAAASRVPFASTSRGGGSQGARTSSGPAPPSAPRSAKTPSSGGGPGRLMIEAHGIDGLGAQSLEQPRTLTQRLEDQLLAASRDDRHRLLSREEKATLEEEKAKQDYFMQSFGFHLALDQLQMLMELLTNWGGTAPEQTTLENLKEVLAPAKGTTNILTTVMKVRTEEEELEDLERMRHQTQEVLLSLKLAYRQNKGLHHVLKDTTKLVQNETRRCDDVKRQLFAEIEGLRWEQHLQPGQYQQEMRALKEKIAELKGELRMWETKIRQQSKSNNRMSQALTDETTARKISEGIADKLRQQQRQHHDGPLSSLSSITGRQIVQSGRPPATMSSAVASVLNKHGLLAAGAGAGAGGGGGGGVTGAAPLQSQHKSQSSIATGISAASSSILEELSDIDEGFDAHWSSFSQRSGDAPTKKTSISAPKRARVTTSSIASVVEEDASPASASIAEGSTASRVKRTKRRRGKKAAPAKDKGDSDADYDDAAPLRGSVALEADDDVDDGPSGVSMHEIMTKPSKQHQTQHRKAKLTADDAERTSRNVAPTRNSFAPADGDQTEKLQLYHDATDIYAQAMRDLSESQKKSR